MPFLRLFVLSASLLLLNACSTIYEVPDHSDLSKSDYPTSSQSSPENIKVRKVHPELLTTKTLVIQSSSNRFDTEFAQFLKKSFKNLGFTEVLDTLEFQQKLIREKLTDHIGHNAPQSLLGLSAISKVTAPFLYIDADVRLANANGVERMRIIDPRTAEVLFDYERSGIIWASMDSEFTYPMMNSVRDWYQESTGGERTPRKPVITELQPAPKQPKKKRYL